jgi:hypothetical protein
MLHVKIKIIYIVKEHINIFYLNKIRKNETKI